MMFEVFIETEVHNNIQQNTLWWAENHSESEAIAWKSLVYKQIAELDTMPERHGFARENDGFPFDLREKLVGKGKRPSYRVLFKIQDTSVIVLQFRAAEQVDWRG